MTPATLSEDGDKPLPPLREDSFDSEVQRPLAVATMDEILSELRLRFKAFVFYGDAHRTEDDLLTTFWGLHGTYSEKVGLSQRLRWQLQKDDD